MIGMISEKEKSSYFRNDAAEEPGAAKMHDKVERRLAVTMLNT